MVLDFKKEKLLSEGVQTLRACRRFASQAADTIAAFEAAFPSFSFKLLEEGITFARRGREGFIPFADDTERRLKKVLLG